MEGLTTENELSEFPKTQNYSNNESMGCGDLLFLKITSRKISTITNFVCHTYEYTSGNLISYSSEN
jgi:hypothetical protein